MKLLGRTINKDDKTIIGNAVAGLFVKGGAILNLFVDGGGCGAFRMRGIVVPDAVKRQLAYRRTQTSGLLYMGGDDFG